MKKGEDYIGLAVIFFCHDGKGNIVFSKRSANCRDEHFTWDIGGGAVEFGDNILDVLKKEIKEEYGTDVIEHEFLGYRDVKREHEGKKTHWIALDFKVLVDPDQVKNGEPHKFDEVKWFRMENLPSPLFSQLPTFLEKYKDRI